MSHQRYPSHDPIKEPHSVSVKVLRLSQPSLVTQYPVQPPFSTRDLATTSAPASLAYASSPSGINTNPEPFLLSPILNLPVSFGSAYVGENFSCTLCANNDLASGTAKRIRDVRIDAEMKTPGLGGAQKLDLSPPSAIASASSAAGVDLEAGDTLQKVLSFDLKEEGNHVLVVTVSYYEATETSGRTRTFRKLYQFICKPSLIVRTKVTHLSQGNSGEEGKGEGTDGDNNASLAAGRKKKWALEAQLENCSEEVIQLEKVVLNVEDGLDYQDCNWQTSSDKKPVLHPTEVEQVCFVVHEKDGIDAATKVNADGRLVFGVLGIGWRGEMGNRGFLSTGKLGARIQS